MRTHLECSVQAQALQYKEDTEQVQHRAIKMSKGLEQLSYEERLRALGLFPMVKRRLWETLTVGINIGGNEDEQVKLFFVVLTDRAPEILSKHKRTLH